MASGRKILALKNLDLVAIALLAVLAIGSFVGGWVLRPPSSGPPPIPNSPTVIINFPPALHLQGLDIISDLMQTNGSQAELKINALGFLGPKQTTVRWSVGVQGFTGHLCTSGIYRRQERVSSEGPGGYGISGTSPVPAAKSGTPFLAVDMCWKSGGPLTVGSSYFSAALPSVFVPYQAGTLTSSLGLSGNSLSAYSPSGGAPPSALVLGMWGWTTALSGNLEFLAGSPMPVFGANALVIQRQNRNAFYSGILFGIAGGAGLSVLPALPGVIDRRKSRRKAAADSGGAGIPVRGPGAPC